MGGNHYVATAFDGAFVTARVLQWKHCKDAGSEGLRLMGHDHNDPTLKDLEERLNRARIKVEPEKQEENPSAMGLAFRMGIDLVAGVGVGLAIGLTLDDWLATPPVFLLVFLVLGFAAGVRNVIRLARKMQEEAEDGRDAEAGDHNTDKA